MWVGFLFKDWVWERVRCLHWRWALRSLHIFCVRGDDHDCFAMITMNAVGGNVFIDDGEEAENEGMDVDLRSVLMV